MDVTKGIGSVFGPAAARTGALSKIDCSVEDLDLDGAVPLDFEFHPLGWAVGSHRHRYFVGAMLWNTVIIVIAAPVCFIIAGWRFAAGGDPCSVALANARFPSLMYLPFFFLIQGLGLAASNCAFFPGAAPGSVAALGWFFLLMITATPAVLWASLLRKKRFRAVAIPDPWLVKNSFSEGGTWWRRRVKRSLYIALHGRLCWVSTSGYFAEHYGFVFEPFRPRRSWWLLPELYIMLLISIFAAWRTDEPAQCHARNFMVVVALGAYLAAMLYFRPYASPLEGVFQCSLATANFIAVLLMASALAAGHSQSASTLWAIAAVFLLISMILQIVTFLVEVVMYLHDHLVGRRPGAWAEQRHNLAAGLLCIGARVRLRPAAAAPLGWRHGETGVVIAIDGDSVVVQLDGEDVVVKASDVEVCHGLLDSYAYDKSDYFGRNDTGEVELEEVPAKQGSRGSGLTPPQEPFRAEASNTEPLLRGDSSPLQSAPQTLQQVGGGRGRHALPPAAGSAPAGASGPAVSFSADTVGGSSATRVSPRNAALLAQFAERLAVEGLEPADLAGWTPEELDEMIASLGFSPPQRLYLRKHVGQQAPRGGDRGASRPVLQRRHTSEVPESPRRMGSSPSMGRGRGSQLAPPSPRARHPLHPAPETGQRAKTDASLPSPPTGRPAAGAVQEDSDRIVVSVVLKRKPAGEQEHLPQSESFGLLTQSVENSTVWSGLTAAAEAAAAGAGRGSGSGRSYAPVSRAESPRYVSAPLLPRPATPETASSATSSSAPPDSGSSPPPSEPAS